MAVRTLRQIAGIAAGVAGVVGLSLAAALRRPLPRTQGALTLPGLEAPVRVLRDRWGVPHIYAETSADLFMAQGFVHGQDRLWQMDFQRHLSHGRLSELIGPIALSTDRYMRILGFGRIARAEVALLAPEARMALEAYARGVNAAIAQSRRRLPIEFTILRHTPEPWTPADTLAWAKVMALNLSGNWSMEVLRARLVAALGTDRASQLDNRYPADHPLIVPVGARYTEQLGEDALRLAEGAAAFAPEGNGQGSNNWVVGGSRSATGSPLLANDPHLAIAIPSIWYENHLSGGDYRVAGASFIGTPGVVIGHNQHIAWGVTNGMTDVQDLYIEEIDPADPGRYRYQESWLPIEIIQESIHIRGQKEPHIETVRVTRHGPIVSPLLSNDDPTTGNGTAAHQQEEQALALRWTALEPAGRIPASILAINRATGWETFREALVDWHVPAQNFVYADVEGNIGYALGGDIPIRARGDGRLPVPGWTGEYEWVGVVPHAELPHAFNPPEGYALSANQRIVGNDFPHPISGEYLSGYRAERIRQLIEQTALHTAKSFARIHADQRSLPGLAIAALAGRLPTNTPIARAARDMLAGWDGELRPDSPAATIYARLRARLLDAAYSDAAEPLSIKTGIGAFASLPGQDMLERSLPMMLRRLTEREDSWLPPGHTWDALLAEVWEATITELRDSYGDDVGNWRYGRWHRLNIRHPLGAIPGLDRLFNRGPFETGGDVDTIHMGNLPRAFASQPYYVAPSYRQILDAGDWNRSKSMHPTGQSGHPSSQHYADFIQPWLDVHYHPMPWDRPQVEEASVEELFLKP